MSTLLTLRLDDWMSTNTSPRGSRDEAATTNLYLPLSVIQVLASSSNEARSVGMDSEGYELALTGL
ncbi:MAG: hypothetical protein LUD46_00245 [Parabacteroides sp.]|nr:hypothetical protein [Parabacteroides sp.]